VLEGVVGDVEGLKLLQAPDLGRNVLDEIVGEVEVLHVLELREKRRGDLLYPAENNMIFNTILFYLKIIKS